MLNDKDYVIDIQINSMKLDVKLVFTFDKVSADISSTPNDNRTPKDEKCVVYFMSWTMLCLASQPRHSLLLFIIFNHKFEKFPEYPQHSLYETLEPTPPGFMRRGWDLITTTTTKAWGFTMRMMTASMNFTLTTWSKCSNITIEVAAKTWNGPGCMAERVDL
ncbi:hypothetical protein ACROYT_G025532 [Oculina patagonica]